MILALAGCGTFGLMQAVLSEEEGGGALSIEGVAPTWGRPDQDTTVTITGQGFSDVQTVWFGNADVEITRIDDTSIIVTAPAAGVETTVDVVVEGPGGEATLEDGFSYRAPDGGGGGSGLTGGRVTLWLTQYSCPDCFGLTSDLQVVAQAVFHDPVAGSWLDGLPDEGSCTTSTSSGQPADAFLDAGDWVYLSSGSRSIDMRGTQGIYTAEDLGESDFVRNAAYDLSATGGADIDAFDVTDVFTTPETLSQVGPVEILLMDRDLFTAQIPRDAAEFTWSPSGGDGSFVVTLGIYSASDATQLGSVVCRGPDNGSIEVPASTLRDYPPGSLIVVWMERYSFGGFERPDDGSWVDAFSTLGVQGTGELVQ